jgi:hypothetical protein
LIESEILWPIWEYSIAQSACLPQAGMEHRVLISETYLIFSAMHYALCVFISGIWDFETYSCHGGRGDDLFEM